MFTKKELQKTWKILEQNITCSLPKTVKYSDYDISVYNDVYIALELNKSWVFFIFDSDKANITIFSHDNLTIDIIEVAVKVKNTLNKCLYPTHTKQAKISKME